MLEAVFNMVRQQQEAEERKTDYQEKDRDHRRTPLSAYLPCRLPERNLYSSMMAIR